MFSIINLYLETLKGRKLLENLNLVLNKGDKLAIIGEEGNGKSTLIKAIIDPNLIKDYCKISGQIQTNEKIGYLQQSLEKEWDNQSVFDFLTKQSPTAEQNFEIFNNVVKLNKLFKQFNLNEGLMESDINISNISGGEKVKLQLIKILLFSPTMLILDEPTNDLDIETLNWLENFILQYNNPIIFISHDETLLENCSNMVLHLEQLARKTKPKFTLFKGNYAEYVAIREKEIEKQTQIALYERREHAKKERILRDIKEKVRDSINNTKDSTAARIIVKKMANVKAQEKRIDNEKLTEIPDVEENIKLLINTQIVFPNQKELLNINLPKLTIGNKILAENINILIKGAKKIAIIGKNGVGKSTMLKAVLPMLKNTIGVKVGYFSQNYAETLNFKNTPVEELDFGNINVQTLLGSLKFTAEEMTHQIINLSEGQKAKLLLLKLILEGDNVLVLDEPTRNLSPLSKPVMRKILHDYKGAIIAVSHDRKFINSVFDEAYELTNSGLNKIYLPI